MDAETIQTIVQEAESEARKTLDEQVRHIEGAGATVTRSYLRQGRPDKEIVDLAERMGAGLIVMGSRGLGRMKRALMGSVSSSVVCHAPCPVLAVRKEDHVVVRPIRIGRAGGDLQSSWGSQFGDADLVPERSEREVKPRVTRIETGDYTLPRVARTRNRYGAAGRMAHIALSAIW